MTEITAILVSMRLPFFGFLACGPRLKKDSEKEDRDKREMFHLYKRECQRISLAFVINC